MTPNLIGLTGRAGTGKDTIGAALVGLGYARVAFADPLKAAAYESDPLIELHPYGMIRRLSYLVDTLGWDEAKKIADVRRYLQRYGTALREQAPGLWTTIATAKIADHLAGSTTPVDRKPRPVVVTDVRFADEVDLIRTLGGVVVRLERKTAPDLGGNGAHVSEQVDALDVDLAVRNDEVSPSWLARRLDGQVRDLRLGVAV